ncbi:MAG: diaminopimelate epimerase [Deltaproteobacteria bacterium]|nr:diaminopimelate epimerase [Deltaproteobacteria bacterium]
MKILFTKMSGCGNDFVVIDHRDEFLKMKDLRAFAKEACHRKNGIGADGLILIEKSDKAAFKWKFFNADGSVPEMCGNGARCAARWAEAHNVAHKQFVFETAIGPIEAQVNQDIVKVQMFKPHDFKLNLKINLKDRDVVLSYVNSGVPHAVLEGDHFKDRASLIRHHEAFPQGANVNFVKHIDRHMLHIQTFERGVEDFTLACGTGAVASAIIFSKKDRVESPVTVRMDGGTVKVYFTENYEKVYLEGSVEMVFKGEWQWKES